MEIENYQKSQQNKLTHYRTKCDVLKEELETWKQKVSDKEKEVEEKNKLINQFESVQSTLNVYKTKFYQQEDQLRQSERSGANLRRLLAERQAAQQEEMTTSQNEEQSECVDLNRDGLSAVIDPDQKHVQIQYIADSGEQKQIRVKISDQLREMSPNQSVRDDGGFVELRNPQLLYGQTSVSPPSHLTKNRISAPIEKLQSQMQKRGKRPFDIEQQDGQTYTDVVMTSEENSLAGLEQEQINMVFQDEYEHPQTGTFAETRRGTIKEWTMSRRGTIREVNYQQTEAMTPFSELKLRKVETVQITEPDSPKGSLVDDAQSQPRAGSTKMKLFQNEQDLQQQIQAIDDRFSMASSVKQNPFTQSVGTRQSQHGADPKKENDKRSQNSKHARAKSTGNSLNLNFNLGQKRQTEPEPQATRQSINTQFLAVKTEKNDHARISVKSMSSATVSAQSVHSTEQTNEEQSFDTGRLSLNSDLAESGIRQKSNMYKALADQKLKLIVRLEKVEFEAQRQKRRADGAIAEVNEYKEMFKSMSDIYGERATGKKACFFCH